MANLSKTRHLFAFTSPRTIEKIIPEIRLLAARQIVDTRNWVIHGYDKVDDVVVWGIILNHLPKLKIEIEGFLNEG